MAPKFEAMVNMEELYEQSDDKNHAFVHTCINGTVQYSNDHENLTVEELPEGDDGNVSDADILRPDIYEDADSLLASEEGNQGRDSRDNAQHHEGFIEGFRALHCHDEEDELTEERERRYGLKKKRWSAGIFKRSHSQSIGSDIDEDSGEPLDAHEVGCSARRLRRRVRGPGDRSSIRVEGGAMESEAEYEESIDGVTIEVPPLGSDVEDGIEDVSVNTTEDAMDIE